MGLEREGVREAELVGECDCRSQRRDCRRRKCMNKRDCGEIENDYMYCKLT